MDYYINSACLSGAFAIPSLITDRHLKLCKAEHLKVILYVFRHSCDDIGNNDISSATGLSEYEVSEALCYWEQSGILCSKQNLLSQAECKPEIKETVTKSLKPGRTDVAKRGLEEPRIRHLLTEAQLKFGRSLKSNEASTLVWLFDDQGLDVSLILLIIQMAADKGKCNIRFIESTAVDWIKNGITTLALADEEIRKSALRDKAWDIVVSAFGIEKRMPSKKESELAYKWIEEWKFSKEMLRAAYEACVDSKSKFSIPYIAKILESWHAKGYTNPESIPARLSSNEKSSKSAAYDLDLFEKMLNSKD